MRHVLTFLFLTFIFINGNLQAQINGGSADFVDTTGYKVAGINDTIYLFYSTNPDKYIEAVTPNGDSATFDWSYYDVGLGSFQSLFSVDNTISRIEVTENMGYRLQITGNGNNYEGQCWALIDDFSVDIFNGDLIESEGVTIKSVPQSQKWCHLIRNIRARIDSADLSYYDPFTGERYSMERVYETSRNSWSANPEADEPGINTFYENDEYYLEIDIEDPYWKDSWYILSVTDNYGVTSKDSIFNETIEPHAEFEFAYIPLDDSVYYPDRYDLYYDPFYRNDDSKSAPALYNFYNLSVNVDTVIWDFGDSLTEHSHADTILHTYHLPGEYYPKIIVYNVVEHLYETCPDTFPKFEEETGLEDYPVVINESDLSLVSETGLPNVFSCPGGSHNYFRFIGDVSITFFEIAIYNRYGKRVYHFEGNIRDWEGWDGHENNSSKYVSSGVYYYVVKKIENLPNFQTGIRHRITPFPTGDESAASGQDNKDKNTLLKGFVHVYHRE